LKFGTGKQIAIVLGFAAVGLATACSSDDDNTGGSTSTTGTTGGGSTGTTSSTTGSATTNTTGSATTTTGGTTSGTGTSGGDGGTTGDAGSIVGTPLYTFDTSVQGFAKNSYGPATVLDADASAVLSWDMGVGNPTPGSLKLEIPFDGLGQQVDYTVGMNGFTDFTCKKMHVLVMVDSGSSGLGVQPYVTSATQETDGAVDNYLFSGSFHSITAANGTWVDYIYDPANAGYSATGFDKTHIRTIGIQILAPGVPMGDAAAPPNPTAAVVHIDSFSLETVAGCSADAGGTTGTTGTTGAGTTTSGGSDGGGSDGGSSDGGREGGTTGAGTTGVTGSTASDAAAGG
jgi:hypothetical protein